MPSILKIVTIIGLMTIFVTKHLTTKQEPDIIEIDGKEYIKEGVMNAIIMQHVYAVK